MYVKYLIILAVTLTSLGLFSKDIEVKESNRIEIRVKDCKGKRIDNLSGLTFISETNSFFAIRNNREVIHEFDKSFKCIRDISMNGWVKRSKTNKNRGKEYDFEGITYLKMTPKGPEFGFVNEIGEVYIGVIGAKTTSINKSDCQKITFNNGEESERPIKKNKGPEGLSYDRSKENFYIVVEGSSKAKDAVPRLETFRRPSSVDSVDLSTSVKAPFNAYNVTKSGDFSGIYFENSTRSIFILSHESHAIYELSIQGELINKFKLPVWRQQEGITIDQKARRILIASEPDVINIYQI